MEGEQHQEQVVPDASGFELGSEAMIGWATGLNPQTVASMGVDDMTRLVSVYQHLDPQMQAAIEARVEELEPDG